MGALHPPLAEPFSSGNRAMFPSMRRASSRALVRCVLSSLHDLSWRPTRRQASEGGYNGDLCNARAFHRAGHHEREDVLQPGFETSGWAYSGSQL
jgi:hypothetical protein